MREVPVYTSALHIQRRWRHYGRIPLPFGPYTAWQQAVYGAVFGLLVSICRVLGIGPDLMVAVIVLAVPWFVQWRLARPQSDGMPAHHWAFGWFQYWTGPKVIVQHQSGWQEEPVHVRIEVWRPVLSPEIAPAPAPAPRAPVVEMEPVPVLPIPPAIPDAPAAPRPEPVTVTMRMPVFRQEPQPEVAATSALVATRPRQVVTRAVYPTRPTGDYLRNLAANPYGPQPRRRGLHPVLRLATLSLIFAASAGAVAMLVTHLGGGAR